MNTIPARDPDAARRRRRLTRAIKESLRELSIQLSLLNHHVRIPCWYRVHMLLSPYCMSYRK